MWVGGGVGGVGALLLASSFSFGEIGDICFALVESMFLERGGGGEFSAGLDIFSFFFLILFIFCTHSHLFPQILSVTSVKSFGKTIPSLPFLPLPSSPSPTNILMAPLISQFFKIFSKKMVRRSLFFLLFLLAPS